MRLSIPLLILLSALFAVAFPIGQRPQQVLSPCNSFESSNDSTSTSSSTSSKWNSWIKSIHASIPTKSSTFKCHSKSNTQSLNTVVTYLSELLQSYRDELLEKKSPQVPRFYTCMGVYSSESSKQLRAGIRFPEVTEKQLGKLDKIFKRQFLIRFPRFEVKKEGSVMLLVER